MPEKSSLFIQPVRGLEPVEINGQADYLYVAANCGRLSLCHMGKPPAERPVERCAQIIVGAQGVPDGSKVVVFRNDTYQILPDAAMFKSLREFSSAHGFDWTYRAADGTEPAHGGNAIGAFHLHRPNQKVTARSVVAEQTRAFKRVPTHRLMLASVRSLIAVRAGV